MSIHDLSHRKSNQLESDQFQTKIIKENIQLTDDLTFLKSKVNFQQQEIEHLNKKLNETEKLNHTLKELIYRKNGIVKIKRKKLRLPYVMSKLSPFKKRYY